VRRGSFLERFATPLAPAVRAIVLKDWRVTIRDLRALSSLFFPLIVFGGLAVSSVLDSDQGVSPAPVVGVLFFAGSLAGSALLNERRNITILRAAPLSPREILTAKVVAFFVPAVAAAWAFSIVLGLVAGRTGLEIVGIVLLVTWSIAAVMIAGVAASALWADFTAERPRLSALPSLTGLCVGAFFAGSTFAVVAWTAARITHRLTGTLAHPLVGAATVVGLQIAAVLLVSLVRAAERRLAFIDTP
jgi:predicted permease